MDLLALVTFVTLVTSTNSQVLLSAFAPIVAVFGHLFVLLFDDHTTINLSGFTAPLIENLKLNNPQTYFAAVDPMVS